MNRFITIFLVTLFASNLLAQSNKEVLTGASYADEVYYSFTEGSLATSPRDNWDVAFAVDRMDVSILANNGAGVELYTYPNGDTASWNSIDTVGMSNWTAMYNSIDDINYGAFLINIDLNNAFDQGWGVYNMNTHNIEGDSLFILKTTLGNYKKVWVINANPNVGANNWTFKYADLDGGNEETVVVDADDHQGYNHMHFSIENNELISKEPASTDWQLYFTRYYDYTIPYFVTGVQVNSRYVQVQQVDGVSQDEYESYTEENYNSNLSEIGSDWKSFDMGTFSWILENQRVYFTKNYNETKTDSSYWKLYFTAFGGSEDGKYSFIQKELGGTAINELADVALFDIYPNPATHQISVVTDSESTLDMVITDITGKMVYRGSLDTGFNQERINIRSFQAGVYNISILSDKGVSSLKFIKQ